MNRALKSLKDSDKNIGKNKINKSAFVVELYWEAWEDIYFWMDNWGLCFRISDCWFPLRLSQLIIASVTSSIRKEESKRVKMEQLHLVVLEKLKMFADLDILYVQRRLCDTKVEQWDNGLSASFPPSSVLFKSVPGESLQGCEKECL